MTLPAWLDPAWFDLIDRRFAWAAVAAALAGLVRGFSGFGAALTFIPLASMVYDPRVAIVALWVVDALGTAPFVPYHLRRADWRDMRWLLVGSTVMLPPGVWVLAHTDPTPLRWGVCLFVLACTAALASGWRYRRKPGPLVSMAVGGVAGFSNGSVGIGGPPLVLFWLSGQTSAAQARSNIFSYFVFTTIIAFALFVWQGIFSAPLIVVGLLLVPFYMLPLKLGDKLFHRGSETTFRLVALLLCGAAAVVGLPVWR